MSCHEMKKRFPDYVTGHIEPEEKKTIEVHLSECPDCKAELARLKEAWTAFDAMPDEEPSAALRSGFYTMLAEEKSRNGKAEKRSFSQSLESWLERWWPKRPGVQLGYSFALLIIGLVVGSQVQSGAHRNGEMSVLRAEIREMRQTVSMSLLNQSSTSARLQGVSFSTRVDEPEESLLSALLNTLNNDPNVNVRLAAVDALIVFSDQPGVREALIESLSKQSSPLVQIAIIDLLVQIRERRSLDAMRQLIQDQGVNDAVKQHAEKRMEELI